MGLFKSIKKGLKKITRGVKKVFKKVVKKVGKILSSKWGKVLMTALTVVSGGMALMAGFQGFTGTAGGFMAKFVTGAKDFVAALANPIKTAKAGLGGQSFAASVRAGEAAKQAAAAGQMIAEAGTRVSPVTSAPQAALEAATTPGAGITPGIAPGAPGAGGISPVIPGAPGMAPPVPTVAQRAAGAQVPGVAARTVGQKAVETAAAEGTGGWLAKAGSLAKDFVTSPGGGRIISGAIKGYAEGKAAEAALEYPHEQWAKHRGALEGIDYDVDVPQGYLSRRVQNPRQVTGRYQQQVEWRPSQVAPAAPAGGY